MVGYPKEVEFISGKRAVLRTVEITDKDKIEEFLLQFPPKEKIFINEAIEESKTLENWIKESKNNIFTPLIAEFKEKIIGMVSSCKAKNAPSINFKNMILLIDNEFKSSRLGSILSRELFSEVLLKRKKMKKQGL
ncbi:MAG TPA: hypothetical protein VMW81_05140 [Nitrospinota bacterium]|nr:hypothetical protein [Nitrospinota bacterium]